MIPLHLRIAGFLSYLDPVELDFNQFDLACISGHNGAGKSTTMKMIAGLIEPTSGTVRVMGQDMLKGSAKVKQKIGYLPEESYLYPFLNARETLDYYGKLFQLDYKVRQRRIDAVVTDLMLTQVETVIASEKLNSATPPQSR